MKKYIILIAISFFFVHAAFAKANPSLSKFLIVGGADNGQKACPMGPAGTYLVSNPKSACGFSWVSFVPSSTPTGVYTILEIGAVNTTTTVQDSPFTQATSGAAAALSAAAVAISLKKKKTTPPQ